VPRLEAMHFDVPVIAYAAAGVPGTMGNAGLLVQEKDFPAVAELVHRVAHDPALRADVVAGQRARLQAFDAETIGATLRHHLETLGTAEALR
jgi:L-malate glycosyltransferase